MTLLHRHEGMESRHGGVAQRSARRLGRVCGRTSCSRRTFPAESSGAISAVPTRATRLASEQHAWLVSVRLEFHTRGVEGAEGQGRGVTEPSCPPKAVFPAASRLGNLPHAAVPKKGALSHVWRRWAHVPAGTNQVMSIVSSSELVSQQNQPGALWRRRAQGIGRQFGLDEDPDS